MEDIIENAGGVVAEARRLVEDYAKAEVIGVSLSDPAGPVSALAIRSNGGVKLIPIDDFDQYRDRPRFRHGIANLLTIESLIDHVNRFKDNSSVVFANNDRKAPTITAVLDYHPQGGAIEAAPRFGKHRSHYAFPLSDEWQAWLGQNGKPLEMREFAEFLEERIVDVLHLIPGEDELPEELQKFVNLCGGVMASPQKLLELSRGLQVYENSAVKQAHRLQSGEGQVSFEVTHTDQDGKPLIVPGLFLIAIPVFRNGPLYRLAARLRYRKTSSGIVFWFDLWRHDRTFDHAFADSVERVKAETALPLLIGKPE